MTRAAILSLLLLFAGTLRAADIYSYKDEKGTLHVVDTPDMIPEKFRGESKSYTHDPNRRIFGDDPCAGKKVCASIFVSPWCEHCQAHLQEYEHYLAANSPAAKEGVRVVVGWGWDPGDNEEFAKKIGYGAVTDDSGAIAKSAFVHTFPNFTVEGLSTPMTGSMAFDWIRKKFDPSAGPLPKDYDHKLCYSNQPRPEPRADAAAQVPAGQTKNEFWTCHANTGTTSCSGKKYCATIYVAPWCPNCNARIGEFQSYLNSGGSSNYGVQVVVGMGKYGGDNRVKAADIGRGAITDDSGSFSRKLGVREVPSFYVLDDYGNIVLKGGQAQSWIRCHF